MEFATVRARQGKLLSQREADVSQTNQEENQLRTDSLNTEKKFNLFTMLPFIYRLITLYVLDEANKSNNQNSRASVSSVYIKKI